MTNWTSGRARPSETRETARRAVLLADSASRAVRPPTHLDGGLQVELLLQQPAAQVLHHHHHRITRMSAIEPAPKTGLQQGCHESSA